MIDRRQFIAGLMTATALPALAKAAPINTLPSGVDEYPWHSVTNTITIEAVQQNHFERAERIVMQAIYRLEIESEQAFIDSMSKPSAPNLIVYDEATAP